MNPSLKEQIIKHAGADSISKIELVQSLWSDFGSLERVWLEGGNVRSVIVKRIQPPVEVNHPRGWNTDFSANRKLKSYQIERHWYKEYVPKMPNDLKVPEFLFHAKINDEDVIAMEDLGASGFTAPYSSNQSCFQKCLEWIAKFHAFHLNADVDGLWEVGTYWHLETRQDEWASMKSGSLKNEAANIDGLLRKCKYQTIVHGDAKPANFCFTEDFNKVAAVDFQYVGRGCGMKDLIYLMSSSLSEAELFDKDEEVLDTYFSYLYSAIKSYNKTSVDFDILKVEWTSLYCVAWVDFMRFLEGWSPNHSRANTYAQRQVDLLLNS